MKTTEWREHDNGKYRTRVTYGWRVIGGQEPYFSMMSDTQRRTLRGWSEDSCGSISREALEIFPELACAAKWDLTFAHTGPMHYAANAVHWAQQIAGVSKWERRSYDPNPIDAFDSTVVLLEGEARPALFSPTMSSASHIEQSVLAWCDERFPRLMARMKADLAQIGVEVPPCDKP